MEAIDKFIYSQLTGRIEKETTEKNGQPHIQIKNKGCELLFLVEQKQMQVIKATGELRYKFPEGYIYHL